MPKASAAKVRRTLVQPRLMTLAELAAYLGLSPSALANLSCHNFIRPAFPPPSGSWAYGTEPPSMLD